MDLLYFYFLSDVLMISMWHVPSEATQKKLMRVKWADHFGGQLSIAKIMEGDSSPPEEEEAADSAVSWSDRKRRDRLREKELLAQVK